MATFLSHGSDILKDASIGSTSTGGNNNAGLIKVNASGGDFTGSEIFDAGYIIEYEIPDAFIGANDELSSGAGISSIVVYASEADYSAGTPLYTYSPQNAGQVATIQSSLDGMGDTYIRFNGGVLVSSDPGAPTLGNMFVAPNSNITQSTDAFVVIDHETDVDLNGDGNITGNEVGDGIFNLGVGVTICYAEGTLISCADGLRRVEDLKEGDLVQTMDNGLQPVLWNGRTVYSALDLLANQKRLPVSISAKRTQTGHDLRVTRQHRMLDTRGFFVKATDIEKLPRSATRIARGVKSVAYRHVLLPRHEVIFANGLASESFYPGPEAVKALGGVARKMIEQRLPALASNPVEEAYGPLARPMAKMRDLEGEWRPVVMIDLDAIELPEMQEAAVA